MKKNKKEGEEAEDEMDELHQENEELHQQLEKLEKENSAMEAKLASVSQERENLGGLKVRRPGGTEREIARTEISAYLESGRWKCNGVEMDSCVHVNTNKPKLCSL